MKIRSLITPELRLNPAALTTYAGPLLVTLQPPARDSIQAHYGLPAHVVYFEPVCTLTLTGELPDSRYVRSISYSPVFGLYHKGVKHMFNWDADVLVASSVSERGKGYVADASALFVPPADALLALDTFVRAEHARLGIGIVPARTED